MTRYALVLVALLGCKDSGQPEHEPAPPPFELPKLGLSIGLQGKTAMVDETYGNGYELRNPSFGAGGAVHVAVLNQLVSAAGQKEDREGAGFTNVVVSESPEGWTMTGERADAMMGGTWFVVSYRDIAGKHTECRSTGILSGAAFQAAVAACASLQATR